MSKETISTVDRVAQAITDAIIAQDAIASPVTLEDGTIAYLDQGVTDIRLVAIAAIKAMREPTDGMVEEGVIMANIPNYALIDGWQAMIDAALPQE